MFHLLVEIIGLLVNVFFVGLFRGAIVGDPVYVIIGLLISLLWGAIVSKAADQWRQQGKAGFVWGFLIGPFGFVVLPRLADHRPHCPKCESVLPSATVTRCRSCGADLPNGPWQPGTTKGP